MRIRIDNNEMGFFFLRDCSTLLRHEYRIIYVLPNGEKREQWVKEREYPSVYVKFLEDLRNLKYKKVIVRRFYMLSINTYTTYHFCYEEVFEPVPMLYLCGGGWGSKIVVTVKAYLTDIESGELIEPTFNSLFIEM